jgi:Amt family ammonium transporter
MRLERGEQRLALDGRHESRIVETAANTNDPDTRSSRELSINGFDAFIAYLRNSGYHADPGQIANAYRVVLLVASGAWPAAQDRLADLLAPIFAQTPAQQFELQQCINDWSGLLFLSPETNGDLQENLELSPSRDRDIADIADTRRGTLNLAALQVRRTRTRLFVLFAAILVAMFMGIFVASKVSPIKTKRAPTNQDNPGALIQKPNQGPTNPSPEKTVAGDWTASIPVVFGLVPPAFAICWILARRARRRVHVHLASSSPRDLAEITVLAPEVPMFEGVETALAVNDLMRPVRTPANEPDIDLCVDATVRAAGLTTLVLRQQPLQSEFVVLIEDGGRHDHLARLGDMALDRLRAAGLIARQYYLIQPRLALDSAGRATTLETIAAAHQGCRLLIMGPGEAIVDPSNGRLAPSLELDANWGQRGFLAIGAIDGATARQLESAGFAVAEATPDGIRRLGHYLAAASEDRGAILSPLLGVSQSQPQPALARMSIRRRSIIAAPVVPGSKASDAWPLSQAIATLSKAMAICALIILFAGLLAIATVKGHSGVSGVANAALFGPPKWLITGDHAWLLTAATYIGLQSIPGFTVLYGGIVKKRWAMNSAFMSIYAFASVLIVWVLFDYNMAFGHAWLSIAGQTFLGAPSLATSAAFTTSQAIIPEAASGMPPLTSPMATLIYFQFVYAAITVIILAGSVLGRMNFTAWMIFCPAWVTLVYTVGAFSLWGGGWLAGLGVADFSGGYVVHLAAGISGFVAAWVVGPRLRADRVNFAPNNLLLALAGAGILWLGSNGFNGGAPYFANADASAAVLNSNIAAAVALLLWMTMDKMAYGKYSVLGAVNGMIAGLVAITAGAGYVDSGNAIIIGGGAGIITWLSVNKLQKTSFMMKVDDTLSVFSTHGVAGLFGGVLVGILANPDVLQYIGTDKEAPGVNVTGWLYGNPDQLRLQVYGAVFIIIYNTIATYIILKVIGFIVPLRMDEVTLKVGDDAVHGEPAYAIGTEGE